ncbi:MAG: HAMP domain-containing protein [Candidatus Fermentithermobacillus carboniphilus]|uniref:histidine kinase n=1 Tax=Candidatus Fermentithermobacillus carboniphilus TaxID=3085328 RepID=A0AAT9L9D9_9FIRM|nr:MAG: HAMP domain-containing protein [Candidatus Fermentithermobacillus carboniphilus]
MKTLRARLVLEFLAVSLVAVILVWAGAVWATRNTFASYLVKQRQARASAIALVLARYYETYGSWDQVGFLLSVGSVGYSGRGMGRGMGSMMDPPSERIILFDAGGSVVYDSLPGYEPVPEELKASAQKIKVNGITVGYVAVVSASAVRGALGRLEEDFLTKVQSALTVSGLVSFSMALVLGARMSLRLARPIERLKDASVKMAKGRFGERVECEDPGIPQEIQELIKAFNAMSQELESVEKKRQELMRDIAHEIRTPLTILSGNLEAIATGVIELDEDTLKVMSGEISRLSGLLSNLEELDRASSGYNFNPRAVSPESLVQKAASSVQGVAGTRSIRVDTFIEGGLPYVFADPDRVQQVFSNLLSNAIRYTPTGGWVKIEARKDSSHKWVVFTVRDSGPGIPDEDMPRVFERFFRGDRSRSRATGGWGLGLAIAKSLVEGSGGSIWVEKDPEGGAAFSFTLPVFVGRPPGENLGE